ncbi:Rab GTPase [Pelomyxa schiedti]|nr:Rab GTPase [Pelomyxa schiedti]
MGNCGPTPNPDNKEGNEVHVAKRKRTPETGIKVVLLGDMATGKTSLVSQLTSNKIPEKHEATIGAAFQVHKIKVDGRDVKLEIWDTAGQERYRSLAPLYYRGASAAIIVYDITNKETFEMCKQWVDELRVRAPNIVVTLAGNKLDLATPNRVVPTADAERFAAIVGQGGLEKPLFLEVSAKTGQNVEQLFHDLAVKLLERASSGNL